MRQKSPISAIGARSRDDVRTIWQASGHPLRAGLSVWRCYERLDWSRQQALLETAATALHLAETGRITARGSLGGMLAVQPYRPAGNGNPQQGSPHGTDPTDLADPWKRAMDALAEAIQEAQENPTAARQLLTMLTYTCRTQTCFDIRRRDLIAAGVPERHLPLSREELSSEPAHEVTLSAGAATAR